MPHLEAAWALIILGAALVALAFRVGRMRGVRAKAIIERSSIQMRRTGVRLQQRHAETIIHGRFQTRDGSMVPFHQTYRGAPWLNFKTDEQVWVRYDPQRPEAVAVDSWKLPTARKLFRNGLAVAGLCLIGVGVQAAHDWGGVSNAAAVEAAKRDAARQRAP